MGSVDDADHEFLVSEPVREAAVWPVCVIDADVDAVPAATLDRRKARHEDGKGSGLERLVLFNINCLISPKTT